MKHLAIDYHFVRDLVQSFELRVIHVSSGDRLVDDVTKPLSQSRVFSLCNNMVLFLVHYLEEAYN